MNGEQSLWVTLRWLGVLPAAVLGCLPAFGFLELLTALLPKASDGGLTWLEGILGGVIGTAAFGASFVVAGAWVAPRGRTAVALVLSAVMLTLAALNTLLYASLVDIDPEGSPRWLQRTAEMLGPLPSPVVFVTSQVFIVVGSIAAVVFVVKRERGRRILERATPFHTTPTTDP
jgi:hypothetical protein